MDTPVGPIGGPGLEIPPGQASDQDALQQAFEKMVINFAFTLLQGIQSDTVHAVASDD
jgi:hypothetical protein